MWSIIPAIYSWIFAAYSGYNKKIIMMTLLPTIWGIRLTYNAWRRGYFSGGLKFWEGMEDYRWEYVRKNIIKNSILWILFNFFFISIF